MTVNKRNIIQQSILSINDGILSALAIIMGLSGISIFLHWCAVFIGGVLAMGRGTYISVRAIANKQNKYSPFKTMVFSGLSFAIGAIIPLLPFVFFMVNSLIFSILFSAISLFVIGYFNHGHDNPLISALLQCISGIFVALITYYIGIQLGGTNGKLL